MLSDQTHTFIAMLAISGWSWLTTYDWFVDVCLLTAMAAVAWWEPK
jgi:hypothetical protein